MFLTTVEKGSVHLITLHQTYSRELSYLFKDNVSHADRLSDTPLGVNGPFSNYLLISHLGMFMQLA